ncbi:MAG: DNA gyrase inhibitor YacG [Proteobacteria bacterium]|nr:DNA gyrase inhibitor YacG [Pseudomonadota bacterium]
MSDGGDIGRRGGAPLCPICRKPAVEKYRPFCSKRCADIDLGRWLTGGYAVPGGDSDADEDGDGLVPPRQEKPDADH